jgi:hypothetical protein
MSKNIFFQLTLLLISSLIVSCEKSINEPIKNAYIPVSIDPNAGTWKTYIIQPNDIPVAEPNAMTSNAYKAELEALKQENMQGSKHKDVINYWAAGSVLRWNEIARELAARYNLAPGLGPDGKYLVPDANNPLNYPKFPFANPPYTARALAYLSVAQYDALVKTWQVKYKYNIVAPFKNDVTIKALMPLNKLPSYPSEDAVVAGASYTILLAMFPGEGPYLESKLKEVKHARTWAGMNVASELAAGETLGKEVAAKIMAKAKTDGMSAANNQTLVPELATAAQNRGVKNSWVSQENPARPPLLPNYGSVSLWNFTKEKQESIRPKLPYLEGSSEFQKELNELKKINSSQTREQARIANYWADGTGSYTPPGHWHRIAADQCYEAKYSEVKTARTLALVGTALMDAGIACWETKYYYFSPRPQQYGLKTSVGLPNFPSYTSGHSTFSAAAAVVLSYIFPEKESIFRAQAKEASESRIYGLIHFRTDCEMGFEHGKKIGNFAIEKGKTDGSGL